MAPRFDRFAAVIRTGRGQVTGQFRPAVFITPCHALFQRLGVREVQEGAFIVRQRSVQHLPIKSVRELISVRTTWLDDPGRGALCELALNFPDVAARQQRQGRNIEGLAQHGRSGEQSCTGFRKVPDLLANDLFNGRRQAPVCRAAGSRPVKQPRQLGEEQRIAGSGLVPCPEIDIARHLAGARVQVLGDFAARQPGQAQELRIAADLPQGFRPGKRARFPFPVRRNNQDGHGRDVAGKVAQQVEAVLVSRVHILEQQDQGPLRGDPGEQHSHRVEELKARLVGLQVGARVLRA